MLSAVELSCSPEIVNNQIEHWFNLRVLINYWEIINLE